MNNERTPEDRILRGTELLEAVKELRREQTHILAQQFEIIAKTRSALKEETEKNCSLATRKALEEFEDIITEKPSIFNTALAITEIKIDEISSNEWETCAVFFDFLEMVENNVPLLEIITAAKQKLPEIEKWSKKYFEHREREEEILRNIELNLAMRPVWTTWLNQVRGVDHILATKIIGNLDTTLKSGETIASHFESPRKMCAFAGLDPEATSDFNTALQDVLLNQVFTLFFSQESEQSGYLRLYNELRIAERRRLLEEGQVIVTLADDVSREGVTSFIQLHNRIRTWVMKIFITHFWQVCREKASLPNKIKDLSDCPVPEYPEFCYLPPIRDLNKNRAN